MPAPAPSKPPATTANVPQQGDAAIVEADGVTVRQVAAKDLARVQEEEGARLATPGEVKAAKLQQEYGGVGNQVATFGLGAADGATFGLAPAAAVAIGGEKVREAIGNRKEANPSAYGGGEVFGVIAPALLSGGAGGVGTVAKVLSAPVRGVAAVGGLAERGVAAVIGHEAKSLALRAAQKGLASAAGGAVEGAAYGVGHEISEAALGGHDLTAERLWAGAKGGALMGGLAGGAMGAGGEILRTGARAVGEAATSAVGKLAGGEGSSLRTLLGEQAEQQAFKATGAKLRDYQKLGADAAAQGERSSAIGRTLLDEGVVTAGASKSDISSRLRAKTQEVGSELGAMRTKLDTSTVRPDVEAIAARVRSEVLEPLGGMPGTHKELGAVASYLDDFVLKAGEQPSFETVHKFRKHLDDRIYAESKSLVADASTAELRKVRRIIEDEFTTSGEKAANELGESFAQKYNLQKELYGKLSTAEKIVGKEVQREAANRAISLTDSIAGGGGGQVGGFLGNAVGGVFGGVAGSVIGGGISAMVNKAVRTYGNQVAADVLNRASGMQALQRAASRTEDKLAEGVSRFLSGASEKAAAVPRAAVNARIATTDNSWGRPEFDRITKAVSEAKANPAAHQAKVSAEIGEMAKIAPNVATAAAMTSMRAVEFLDSKRPPGRFDTHSLTPMVPRPVQKTLTPDEMRFMRYAKAVEAPLSVLDDMHNGKASREGVEALKAVYPSLYGDLTKTVFAHLAKHPPKTELETKQAIQLGILLGQPTHYTLAPEFKNAVQGTKAPPQEPAPDGQQAAPPPSGGALDIDTNMMMTATDAIGAAA